VDLSADYKEHLGWCVLAPRWQRDLGLRRHTLKLEQLAAYAQQAPPDSPWRNLPALISDPTLEDAAVEFLSGWYDFYVTSNLPEDLRERAPKVDEARVRRAVRDLRAEGKAIVPLPYLCRNEPEIIALKPWDEVFVPGELTTENEIVFQVERVTEAELRSRSTAMGYDEKWVEEALKHKGTWATGRLSEGTPQGLSGQLNGTHQVGSSAALTGEDGAVEIVYAVYRAADEDNIPAVYCTTFHESVCGKDGETMVGKHELVESVDGELPYVGVLRERWCRSLTSSRGVPEMAHTHQNIIKAIYDGVLDRQSITLSPPVNVYESPTGATYRFGPFRKNYVRQGKEPQFMQMPSGQGLVDTSNTYTLVKAQLDNRFGLLAPDVPAPRQQITQEHAVRRFLVSWSKAFKHILCLYQKHGDDKEFARVTGAPEGWLEEHREAPGALSCALDFDVRELDSELEMKRIEAVNKLALPNDVLGVVNRAEWAGDMIRGILGPRRAKRLVRSTPEASGALREKAHAEILKMFAGNQPSFLDDKDPTASGLLQFTREIVMANPVYLAALNDEALVALAGPQQAQMIAQSLPRQPNERFSGLILKWLENLKFIGVTQVQNRQIGRMGVNPGEEQQ